MEQSGSDEKLRAQENLLNAVNNARKKLLDEHSEPDLKTPVKESFTVGGKTFTFQYSTQVDMVELEEGEEPIAIRHIATQLLDNEGKMLIIRTYDLTKGEDPEIVEVESHMETRKGEEGKGYGRISLLQTIPILENARRYPDIAGKTIRSYLTDSAVGLEKPREGWTSAMAREMGFAQAPHNPKVWVKDIPPLPPKPANK